MSYSTFNTFIVVALCVHKYIINIPKYNCVDCPNILTQKAGPSSFIPAGKYWMDFGSLSPPY